MASRIGQAHPDLSFQVAEFMAWEPHRGSPFLGGIIARRAIVAYLFARMCDFGFASAATRPVRDSLFLWPALRRMPIVMSYKRLSYLEGEDDIGRVDFRRPCVRPCLYGFLDTSHMPIM